MTQAFLCFFFAWAGLAFTTLAALFLLSFAALAEVAAATIMSIASAKPVVLVALLSTIS